MILTKKTGGGGGGTNTIGNAEDGTYTDGLFTDFVSSTPTGIAIDRFNEVLKALAPGPAPTLDQISCADTGVTCKLSWGISNNITGYINVDTTAGNNTVDINELYSVTGTRRGAFSGATTINGILNDDVTANGLNYPDNSFGDGDQGELRLEVNGVIVHTIDLSTFGSGVDVNVDGSGFDLSAATSVQFESGDPFDSFKYRTGTWVVTPTTQRNGFNYIRVNHFINSTNNFSGYYEWVNDPDADVIFAHTGNFRNLVMSGSKYLSGVQYHTGGAAQYDVIIEHCHENVYSSSNSAVSFPTLNCSASSQALGPITSELEAEVIVNKSVIVDNSSRILNGSIGIGVSCQHPLKSNIVNQENQTIVGILLDNISTTSTQTVEYFCIESYRMVSTPNANTNNYNTQLDVNNVLNAWDSAISIHDSSIAGYTDGVLFFNGTMRYPIRGIDNGDFRNVVDGNLNGPEYGPDGNPNYNGVTGIRYLYRKFRNNTGLVKANYKFNIQGIGDWVDVVTGANGQNLTFEVKFPTGDLSVGTGWMDLYKDFATNQWSDGDGARNATEGLGRAMGVDWGGTVGTKSIDVDEWIVVRIGTSSTWTGTISQITLTWL